MDTKKDLELLKMQCAITLFIQEMQHKSIWPCRVDTGGAPMELASKELYALRDNLVDSLYNSNTTGTTLET